MADVGRISIQQNFTIIIMFKIMQITTHTDRLAFQANLAFLVMSVCEHRHSVFVWILYYVCVWTQTFCFCMNSLFIYFFLSIYLSFFLSFRQICPANFWKTTIATIFKFGVPMPLAVKVGAWLCVVMMFKIMQIRYIWIFQSALPSKLLQIEPWFQMLSIGLQVLRF